MIFEQTIRLGDILTFLGALFVGAGLLIRWGGGGQKLIDSLMQTKEELKQVREELEKLAEVITLQAVQTNQISNLTSQVTMIQRSIEDLRRGNGWIRTIPRTSVDGEY